MQSQLIRLATSTDADRIVSLIARSARAFGRAHYTPAQIEAALLGAWGLDTQLIRDGTFFVVETPQSLVGCGGWSFRRTLFGGDSEASRDAAVLDPRTEAARIRAFFVDPDHGRRGVASAILAECEKAAARQGFIRFELMATLPGVPFYTAHGYQAGLPVQRSLGGDLGIEFVPMAKRVPS